MHILHWPSLDSQGQHGPVTCWAARPFLRFSPHVHAPTRPFTVGREAHLGSLTYTSAALALVGSEARPSGSPDGAGYPDAFSQRPPAKFCSCLTPESPGRRSQDSARYKCC